MNDVPDRRIKVEGRTGFGVAGVARSDRGTGFGQTRSGRLVYRPVHAPAAQQRLVGRRNDYIDLLADDVAQHYVDPRHGADDDTLAVDDISHPVCGGCGWDGGGD